MKQGHDWKIQTEMSGPAGHGIPKWDLKPGAVQKAGQ
jgi:hypothetical protein